ncbi:MAG: PQQ-binding-like beta-propeller repeat protein [Desulfobacteraceae bacterium]
MKEKEQNIWQARLAQAGFRGAAIAYLRDRLRQEHRTGRLEGLISRLRKYDSHVEIVKLLKENPVCQERLEQNVGELPEVSRNPQDHFVFQAEGNIAQTPILGADRLFFGSGSSFYALNAETGAIVWQRRSSRKTWSPAWLSKESLFVCNDGRLLALSPEDGREQWRFQTQKRLTAPFAHRSQVLAGSEEGTLYALDAKNGSRLWTFNVAQSISVAAGICQNRILAASKDHSLYAVDREEGECAWHFTTGGQIRAVPGIFGDIVYLPSADHQVYALHASRGRLLWSFKTKGEVHTSPLRIDDRVYVGSRDRCLYALHAEDGTEIWSRQMFGYPSSAIASGGMLYLTAQGRVYAFSLTDQRLRWCFPLGASFATAPVMGNSRIYVGTLQARMVCLKFTSYLEEQAATQVLERWLEPSYNTCC